MGLIHARNLTLPHGRLRSVPLDLQHGELLGLIGPNGAGKSSLLACLAGLLPCEGEITILQQPLNTLADRQRARTIGLLPQSGASAWNMQVRDVVALGRLPWGDEHPAAIALAMKRTGVSGLSQRRIHQLSGGERARVWLARVLAGEPQILLADEPIASLDLHYQRSIMQCLRAHARSARGAIVALHDLTLAARYCDRICLLQAGAEVATGTPAQVLTAERLSEVFRTPVHVDLQAHPPVVTPL